MIRIAALCASLLLIPLSSAAIAETFRVVSSKSDFVSLIAGRHLTRQGIKLAVSPSGQIAGRGFGRDVTGDWTWNGGYFCRDLFWGRRDLGFNCQMVQVNGSTLRFISDRGNGRYADLRLR